MESDSYLSNNHDAAAKTTAYPSIDALLGAFETLARREALTVPSDLKGENHFSQLMARAKKLTREAVELQKPEHGASSVSVHEIKGAAMAIGDYSRSFGRTAPESHKQFEQAASDVAFSLVSRAYYSSDKTLGFGEISSGVSRQPDQKLAAELSERNFDGS